MEIFNIEFSEPDKYGEIHSRIKLPLSIQEKSAELQISVNGNPAAIYRLNYSDAGTIGYSAMKGKYAVQGRLINVSMDWANPSPSDYGIINAVGSIDNGQATLHLWRRVAK